MVVLSFFYCIVLLIFLSVNTHVKPQLPYIVRVNNCTNQFQWGMTQLCLYLMCLKQLYATIIFAKIIWTFIKNNCLQSFRVKNGQKKLSWLFWVSVLSSAIRQTSVDFVILRHVRTIWSESAEFWRVHDLYTKPMKFTLNDGRQ